MSRPVDVFFYGSYINPDVLAESGLTLRSPSVGRVDDVELIIAPRANLIPAPGAAAWGIVAPMTHDELDRLYAHARDVLGGVYLPEAVLVTNRDGSSLPALTYLCHDLSGQPAEAAYVERIARPAESYAFPAAYINHIRSFTPTTP